MPDCTAYCAIVKYSLAGFSLTLGLKTHQDRLTNIDFLSPERAVIPPINSFSKDITDQLNRYIKDGRREFQIALEPSGTPVEKIPYP